jgi:hypothetical protein
MESTVFWRWCMTPRITGFLRIPETQQSLGSFDANIVLRLCSPGTPKQYDVQFKDALVKEIFHRDQDIGLSSAYYF